MPRGLDDPIKERCRTCSKILIEINKKNSRLDKRKESISLRYNQWVVRRKIRDRTATSQPSFIEEDIDCDDCPLAHKPNHGPHAVTCSDKLTLYTATSSSNNYQ